MNTIVDIKFHDKTAIRNPGYGTVKSFMKDIEEIINILNQIPNKNNTISKHRTTIENFQQKCLYFAENFKRVVPNKTVIFNDILFVKSCLEFIKPSDDNPIKN